MNVNLQNCDCLVGMKELPDNSIDLIFTSPPYNCGIEYDSWNDNLPWDEYLNWTKSWLTECRRVLKPDGRIAVNVLLNMGLLGNTVRVSPVAEIIRLYQEVGINLMSTSIWVENTRSRNTAWGSYLSASSPYIYCPYEGIVIGYKESKKKLTKGVSTISKEDFIMGCSGMWKIAPETRGMTIANFPVALPKLAIELLSYEGDTVLDPFAGSGTTAIACIRTKRNFVGFEISPNYFSVAMERIAEERISQLF